MEYMSDHIVKFSNFMALDSNLSWKDYLKKMALDGTWGSHLELQALSDHLSLEIFIHMKDKEPIIIGPPSPEEFNTI